MGLLAGVITAVVKTRNYFTRADVRCDHDDLHHIEESITGYRRGGYHPVKLGDKFQKGRYKVAHKLGYGDGAMVWLAQDRRTAKWVALKIGRGGSRTVFHERGVLNRLSALEQNCFARVEDSFTHRGPNGLHQCTVVEFLGPSLLTMLRLYAGDTRFEEIRMDGDAIIKIVTQLLKAVESLHKLGLCHGNIHPGNIVWRPQKTLEKASTQRLFHVIGFPEFCGLHLANNKEVPPSLPCQLAESAEWRNFFEDDEDEICLVGFGQSFADIHKPQKLRQTVDFDAPETILGDHFDHTVDLWGVGCTIYHLICGKGPFSANDHKPWLVKSMMSLCGRLPDMWKDKWAAMQPKNEDNRIKRCSLVNEIPTLGAGDEDISFLVPIMQGLLRFDPLDRMTATEALASIKATMDTRGHGSTSSTQEEGTGGEPMDVDEEPWSLESMGVGWDRSAEEGIWSMASR